MLFRQDGMTPFTVGRSTFTDRIEQGQDTTAKVYVPIAPESLGAVVLAQLDTAAAWTILDAPIAGELALFDRDGEIVRLSTRQGTMAGRLVRTSLEIVAEEGDSQWTHGSFLGYGGLLERIRFAVDPGTDSFYFGPM
jgi:hypothetical protein